jgi:WD40 repeat protein
MMEMKYYAKIHKWSLLRTYCPQDHPSSITTTTTTRFTSKANQANKRNEIASYRINIYHHHHIFISVQKSAIHQEIKLKTIVAIDRNIFEYIEKMLTNTKLKGHRAAVLCLDISSPSLSSSSSSSSTSSLLLSGSEDGTARLWDLREHKRRGACLCIQTVDGGDVLSAVFAPPQRRRRRPTRTTANEDNDNPTTTASSFAQDYTVYLGVENTVLEYDLRNATSPILSEPTNNWDSVLQNQDEVNQIGLAYYNNNNNNNNTTRNKNKKNQKKKKGGNNKKQQYSNHQRADNDDGDNDDGNEGSSSCIEGSSLYLAACDDAGKIRYTETSSSSSSSSNYSYNNDSNSSCSSTILHHDEHGVAVVTACAFRPQNNNKQLELISGGTDCKIQLWDILRPK